MTSRLQKQLVPGRVGLPRVLVPEPAGVMGLMQLLPVSQLEPAWERALPQPPA
jgi:hypothetical protein